MLNSEDGCLAAASLALLDRLNSEDGCLAAASLALLDRVLTKLDGDLIESSRSGSFRRLVEPPLVDRLDS